MALGIICPECFCEEGWGDIFCTCHCHDKERSNFVDAAGALKDYSRPAELFGCRRCGAPKLQPCKPDCRGELVIVK